MIVIIGVKMVQKVNADQGKMNGNFEQRKHKNGLFYS